jgi:hypothetical protein
VESAAERFARFDPNETPEMVEFWRFVFVITPAFERPAKLTFPERESVVPCAFVKKRFWSELDADVLVAVTVPTRRFPMEEVERVATFAWKYVVVAWVEVERTDVSRAIVEDALNGVRSPTAVEVGVR